jgi:hypothetical protein
MTVKNVVKAALLCVLAPIAVAAQREQRTPEERANRQTEWMKKNLSITPEQSIKAHDIFLVHARSVESAPRGAGRRELIKSEMNARDNELRGVLTADQFSRYRQREEEMREKMQQRREMKQ